jgi:hypothetical protein
MAFPPVIAVLAIQAVSPSAAQPVLPAVEAISSRKLPVTELPGETPRNPPLMSQAKEPAQVAVAPAWRAKFSQSPRSIGTVSSSSRRSAPSPLAPRRWEHVAGAAIACQRRGKNSVSDELPRNKVSRCDTATAYLGDACEEKESQFDLLEQVCR